MSGKTFAVDWDGTCVEDNWPKQGDWLPGAVRGLWALTRLGSVLIYTCRISPMERGTEDVPRPVAVVQEERNYIRRLLDEQGLHTVRIWDKPWKPSADEYIDNKGRRYLGRPKSWDILADQMQALYGREGQ